jgi:hypothetical protein
MGDGGRAACAHARRAHQDTLRRIERALSQRLYLVHRQVDDELKQTFAVLGSTGNVYAVVVGSQPACTCPDHAKGNLCKHILFVFLRVLRVSSTNPVVWQTALLTAELREIFASAPSVGAAPLASAAVRRTWSHVSGVPPNDEGPVAAAPIERKPVSGPCPICFEDMEDEASAAGRRPAEATVWCKATCGQSLHASCFRQWTAHSKGAPTCPYCRSAWEGAGDGTGSARGGGGGAQAAGPGGYINLGELQPGTEVNPAPFTSFHGGARRGSWARWRRW